MKGLTKTNTFQIAHELKSKRVVNNAWKAPRPHSSADIAHLITPGASKREQQSVSITPMDTDQRKRFSSNNNINKRKTSTFDPSKYVKLQRQKIEMNRQQAQSGIRDQFIKPSLNNSQNLSVSRISQADLNQTLVQSSKRMHNFKGQDYNCGGSRNSSLNLINIEKQKSPATSIDQRSKHSKVHLQHAAFSAQSSRKIMLSELSKGVLGN